MQVPGLAIPKENKTRISQAKMESLARDLSALQLQPTVKLANNIAIPAFQRQGYLEKMGHNRAKWFKRFFVLRDSFLLSYNLQKSDFTTEPRSAIHLGNCKVTYVDRDATCEKDFCFSVITETGDQFLFSASSNEDRQAWVDDFMTARLVTHANMVKLAVENACLAEEKGVGHITREQSTSSLAIFSNPAYVQATPLTGGMEGWLQTLGFNNAPAEGKKPTWKKCYFMLRDSHLLMFNAGDMLSKPRGVMYLVGATVEPLEGDEEQPHRFVVGSQACGDMIELSANSQKSLKRWTEALSVGTRVTYPDYVLLERERQILASLVLTPRAPTPRGPGGAPQMREHVPSVLDEEVDIMGNALAPGAVQPYDKEGNPLVRDPLGHLVNPMTGQLLPPTAERFSAAGEPLDAFNRPLPPNAVAMFNENGVPIGIGPDGRHYTPDGEVVDKHQPHFDSAGAKISQETVTAAELVAPTIAVAVKVRAALKGDQDAPMLVDPLGRSLKTDGSTDITEDGEKVPTTARRVEVGGKLMTYDEAKKAESVEIVTPVLKEQLNIKMENDDGEVDLGIVEIDGNTVLADVRSTVSHQMNIPDFVFIHDGVRISKYEEKSKLAIKFLPTIHVRGRELTSEKPAKVFQARVKHDDTNKDQEAAEFMDIMNRVRNKTFLHHVGRDLTK